MSNEHILIFDHQFDEDNYGVKYADECEVCKVVSDEFVARLSGINTI